MYGQNLFPSYNYLDAQLENFVKRMDRIRERSEDKTMNKWLAFTVWQYRMNRNRGGNISEAVDYAIALRIRPKLMTAIGAVLALMPLALGIGLGAQMQQPLAVAVISASPAPASRRPRAAR